MSLIWTASPSFVFPQSAKLFPNFLVENRFIYAKRDRKGSIDITGFKPSCFTSHGASTQTTQQGSQVLLQRRESSVASPLAKKANCVCWITKSTVFLKIFKYVIRNCQGLAVFLPLHCSHNMETEAGNPTNWACWVLLSLKLCHCCIGMQLKEWRSLLNSQRWIVYDKHYNSVGWAASNILWNSETDNGHIHFSLLSLLKEVCNFSLKLFSFLTHLVLLLHS